MKLFAFVGSEISESRRGCQAKRCCLAASHTSGRAWDLDLSSSRRKSGYTAHAPYLSRKQFDNARLVNEYCEWFWLSRWQSNQCTFGAASKGL